MERTTGTNIRYAGTVLMTVVLAALIIYTGIAGNGSDWRYSLGRQITEQARRIYMPVLAWQAEVSGSGRGKWLREKALVWFPLVSYTEDHAFQETSLEDGDTMAMILDAQTSQTGEAENGDEGGGEKSAEKSSSAAVTAVDTSIEKLRDFEYLLSNFYTVDSSTVIGEDQLNADELLGKNMKIDTKTDGPKILVFHTHSQEEFIDSTPGDPATSIVGVGAYLTELLNEKGIETMHDTSVYDVIDGKLDRSMAYDYSEEGVTRILEENPSIEVLIDLHRDGVAEDTHLVTEINGKPTAKIMFFNGLSRSRTNGEITYLKNPYIQDNLAFSFQMHLAAETKNSGFTRHIYLKAYRYSLHMMPKSLLIEAGAQTNTVEEMMNAMEPLSEALYDVLISS